METQINIDKAKYEASLGKRSVEYFSDGSMRFKIPSVDIPDEIKATYTVNGVEQDDTSTIKDSGVYVVTAHFESENYEVEDVKTVYYVDPPIIGNDAKYELHIDRMTDEPADENGQIKVMIWMDYKTDDISLGQMQYAIRYDENILKYVSAEKGNGMSLVTQHPYSTVDGANADGTGAAITFGSIADQGELVTLTFELKDPNAKDVALNLTGIYGKPGIYDTTEYKTYGTGIHLLQQQDTNVCRVYLSKPSKTAETSASKVSQNSLTVAETSKADETKAEEVSNVVNNTSEDEQCSTDEIQSDVQKLNQQVEDASDAEEIEKSEADEKKELIEDIKEGEDKEQKAEKEEKDNQESSCEPDVLKESDSSYEGNESGKVTDETIQDDENDENCDTMNQIIENDKINNSNENNDEDESDTAENASDEEESLSNNEN